MKKTILFISSLFFAVLHINAQHNCATDILHQKMMQTDSVYKSNFEKIEKHVFNLRNSNTNNFRQQSISIPVVVHVMHLGEPEGNGSNISDAQIVDAIDGLNDRYSNAIGNGLDMEIEFCLASSDPQGCSTSGINRADASIIPGYEEFGIGPYCDSAASASQIKDLSRWPVSDYYNIWVVHRIPRENCSQVWGGYAFYPNGGRYDGATMRAQSMTYNSSVLAHELGHGLSLRHTFHGDDSNTNCPVDDDCTVDGDRICDTPPHKQGDCGSSNPCTASGIWNNSRYNYMSYCSTPQSAERFTQGQKDLVMATMQSFPRQDLLSSTGCNLPSLGIQLTAMDLTCDSICDGTLTANTNCTATYTYLWSTQDTTKTISNLCAGTYVVTITANGISEIDSATISVRPAPSVSFNIPMNNRLLCEDEGSIFLSGEVPIGGVFSGPGVSSNLFYPQIAGLGKHVITYSFPNIPACAVSVSDTITVEKCVGIDETDLMNQISVAPNPVHSSLYINWKQEADLQQITLRDLSGKRIEIFDLLQGTTSFEINMAYLPQGLYFLTLKGHAYKTVKLIKTGF